MGLHSPPLLPGDAGYIQPSRAIWPCGAMDPNGLFTCDLDSGHSGTHAAHRVSPVVGYAIFVQWATWQQWERGQDNATLAYAIARDAFNHIARNVRAQVEATPWPDRLDPIIAPFESDWVERGNPYANTCDAPMSLPGPLCTLPDAHEGPHMKHTEADSIEWRWDTPFDQEAATEAVTNMLRAALATDWRP